MNKFRIYITILSIYLASISVTFAAANCAICGSTIAGKYYISSRQQVVCVECNAKYPACSGCGLVAKSAMSVDGIAYCRECYLKLPQCDICNSRITGGYNHYPDIGVDVCSTCERYSPRCDNCKRPSKDLTEVGRSNLCQLCTVKADRCRNCGNALLRDFSYFEGNKTIKYCAACVSKYPACADCGAPSGPEGTLLDDNRHLCRDCAVVALFDPALVTPIKNTVIGYMANIMGMTVSHEITYYLKGKDFLDSKSKQNHKDLNGLFYRVGDDYNIYILYGLREKDMIWVIAHEISHAWQAENTSGNLEPEDLEGFAQWVAYNALKYSRYDTFAEILTNGNTAYSKGLRKMIEIEKNNGFKGVFEYIKSK